MTQPSHTASAASVAALLLLTACLGAAPAPAGPAPRSADAEAAPPAPRPDLAELEELYHARQDSALTRFTAADVHFMSGMIGHHAQAVVMSRLAPERDASRAVRTLAARIINAQQDEITLMQDWLRDRGQVVPRVHISGTDLRVEGHEHAMHMPGMLDAEQMRRLAAARGTEFDRLFLTLMIQHHRGAVVMVDELLASDGAAQDPAVFQLAADIHVDQLTEIARMQRMLNALPPFPETGNR